MAKEPFTIRETDSLGIHEIELVDTPNKSARTLRIVIEVSVLTPLPNLQKNLEHARDLLDKQIKAMQ